MNGNRWKRRLAFTLIELLVAMAVVAILAAMTIGAWPSIQIWAARSRAKAEISAISTALKSFETENGACPAAPALDAKSAFAPSDYKASGIILFTNLVGRTAYGTAGSGAKAYLTVKESQVGSTKDHFVDPWGNPYGYTTGTHAFNTPFFDLWTTGGKTAADGTNSWIVNWPDPVRESVN